MFEEIESEFPGFLSFLDTLKTLLSIALVQPEKLHDYSKEIEQCLRVTYKISFLVEKPTASAEAEGEVEALEESKEIEETLTKLQNILSLRIAEAIEQTLEENPEARKEVEKLKAEFGIKFHLVVGALLKHDSLSKTLSDEDKRWLRSIGYDPDREIEHS